MMNEFKFIGEGLKMRNPDRSYNPNFNVLNILRTLVEDDESSTVYIPFDYKKDSSSRNSDPRVHYLPYESGRPIEITGLQSNKERFNFSITGIINVLVEYDNEDNTVSLMNRKVFRQYHIVRDGQLVIDHLVAKLSRDAFENLRDSGILYYNGADVKSNHLYNSDFLYKISLKDVPIVSLNWAQPVNIGLYNYMREEIDLTSELQLIRKLIKKYNSEGKFINDCSGNDMVYIEKSSDTNEDNILVNKKKVDCIVYELLDYKSSITEDEVAKRYPDIESAESAKTNMNSRLRNIRFIMRCIVAAIECSSKKGSYNWSELELVPRSKEKYQQKCTVSVNGSDIAIRRLQYQVEV